MERRTNRLQPIDAMILHPRQFVKFLDGRGGDRIAIAFLPGVLGAHIKTFETRVSLSREYAWKIIKHKINYQGFDEIQDCIDNGVCMLDGEFHLSFLYVKDKIKPEIYFLLVKTNKLRNELWLVTFHRIHSVQFSRRLEPLRIIRPHKQEPEVPFGRIEDDE